MQAKLRPHTPAHSSKTSVQLRAQTLHYLDRSSTLTPYETVSCSYQAWPILLIALMQETH